MDQNSIYFKQVRLLLDVLPHVNKESIFALKGGTAINLFIRNMPRLSVDIDLVYLPVESRSESLKNISSRFENMAQNIESHLRYSKVHRLCQRNDNQLSKLLVERNGVRIKIEVSPVIRGTVRDSLLMQNTTENVQEHFGFVSARIVHFDDLYASKICAALDRQHPRDFFDIRGLLDNEGINDELMNVFIVYLISSNQPISKLLNPNLIDISKTYQDQFIGMTSTPASLDLLENTRKELITAVNKKLSDSHKNFLLGFKKGHPDWSLLPFETIHALPSIKWKLLNLNQMDTKTREIAIQKLKGILSR